MDTHSDAKQQINDKELIKVFKYDLERDALLAQNQIDFTRFSGLHTGSEIIIYKMPA